jgi:hypothetical protein
MGSDFDVPDASYENVDSLLRGWSYGNEIHDPSAGWVPRVTFHTPNAPRIGYLMLVFQDEAVTMPAKNEDGYGYYAPNGAFVTSAGHLTAYDAQVAQIHQHQRWARNIRNLILGVVVVHVRASGVVTPVFADIVPTARYISTFFHDRWHLFNIMLDRWRARDYELADLLPIIHNAVAYYGLDQLIGLRLVYDNSGSMTVHNVPGKDALIELLDDPAGPVTWAGGVPHIDEGGFGHEQWARAVHEHVPDWVGVPQP